MGKMLLTTLIFIFLIVNVSAIEVSEYEGTIPTGTDTNPNIQLITKIATLENKIINLPTKTDMETQTAFIYNNLSKKFNDKTDIQILTFIFIQLFQLGLGFSIFLYLKSQRRI